ncbi:efflux RND transporter periplasmic adaptor subunit [Gimesia aquarii]|uniref:Macrolide export protein MacA n=1 Tax=Gimesia aquarii TaxID=2527964 RepID=A0A517VSA6_9PLAN|nr:efflux RND transporter periplasmic adaptor subunit [Gimesia aquarii]QDT95898.1 Macrolide export protein MacA [Gimesia aquarii]
MKLSRSWNIIFAIVVIATIAIAALSSNKSELRSVVAGNAKSRFLSEEQDKWIGALGRIEPRSRIRRISPWGGSRSSVITELHVNTGDIVQKGQLLATFDTFAQRSSEVAVAKANVATALARLQKIKSGEEPETIDAKRAELKLVRTRMESLRKELERSKRLDYSKAITVHELEKVQLRFDEAVLNIQQFTSELAAMENVRAVDITLSEAELKTAEAELQLQLALLEATQVFAPIDGKVLKLHAHAGETIGDQGILELADMEHLQVVAEIFEADIAKLSVGMSAEMSVISMNQRFKGSIAEIGQLVGRQDVLSVDPVSDVDARVVEVRIDLEPDIVQALARLSNARVEVVIKPEGSRDLSVDRGLP